MSTWIGPPAGSLPTGQGYQCADCGYYFPRSRVKDIGGEYYCRDGMGHNATPGAPPPARPAGATAAPATAVGVRLGHDHTRDDEP